MVLEDEDILSSFNKSLIKLTKVRPIEANKKELADIKLFMDLIKRKRLSIEDKKSLLKNVEEKYNKIETNNLVHKLCKENLNKAQVLIKKEELQLKEYLNHYMALSQKFLNEELTALDISS